MTKDQKLGQLRALLTALGSSLATWGFLDPAGGAWAPAVGILIAGFSMTWGILHHRDPKKPGRLSWSLVRKFLNIAGSAAATYGFTSPERAESLVAVLALLGPVFAWFFTIVDNDEGPGAITGGPGVGMILLLLAGTMFLPSCGTGGLALDVDRFGCIGTATSYQGQNYTVRVCPDGTQKFEWENPEGIDFRAVRPQGEGSFVIQYGDAEADEWFEWGSKSAVDPGFVPEEVSGPAERPIVLPTISSAGWPSGYGSGFMLRDRGARPCHHPLS